MNHETKARRSIGQRGTKPLAMFCATVLTLVACGGQPATQSPSGAPGTDPTDGGQTDAPSTPASGEPQYGGTLVVGQPFGPITLDPMIDPGADGIYILEQVMEGLMRINEDQSIGPGLAESWEISDDALVWTFTLRQGVEFHNGDPFTADDVLFTFERLMDADGPASFSALYIDQIARVEKLGDYEVAIHMTRPWPAFPIFASTNHTKILNQRSVEEAGDQFGFTSLVGTGYFKLDRWDQQDQVVLVRNENYWQEDLPYLDGLTYKLLPEAATARLALELGEVDVLQDPPVDQLEALRGNEDVTVLAAPGAAMMIVGLNPDVPPFDDVRVRQAFTFGIDRQEIVDVVFFGTAQPAGDFFPSFFWADDPDFEIPHDPDRAEQLLADAGYDQSNPLEFELQVYNFPPYTDMGQLVQDQLARIGVQVDIVPLDSQTVISNLRRLGEPYQAAMWRHIARANHWEFTGNKFATNGKLNFGDYNQEGATLQNPAAQELFEQVELLTDFLEEDQELARPVYSELSEIVYIDDVVNVMMVHQDNLEAIRKRVHGYPSGGYDWAPVWKTWISEED